MSHPPPPETLSSLLRTNSNKTITSPLVMVDMDNAELPGRRRTLLTKKVASTNSNNGGAPPAVGAGDNNNGDVNDGVDIITSSIVHNAHHKKPFKSWARGVLVRQICHSELATRYDRTDKILNTVTVTLTALSSSAIFAAVNPSVNNSFPGGKNYLSWAAGFVSVISTILQAVMRALSYASQAEQHKLAARQYTKARFRLEIICGNNYVDDGHLNTDKVAGWTREYEELLDSTPVLSQKQVLQKLDIILKAEDAGIWEKHQNDNEYHHDHEAAVDHFDEDFLEPLISRED